MTIKVDDENTSRNILTKHEIQDRSIESENVKTCNDKN